MTPGPCALCSHDPACGHAAIDHGEGLAWYCHTDDHSCYQTAATNPSLARGLQQAQAGQLKPLGFTINTDTEDQVNAKQWQPSPWWWLRHPTLWRDWLTCPDCRRFHG